MPMNPPKQSPTTINTITKAINPEILGSTSITIPPNKNMITTVLNLPSLSDTHPPENPSARVRKSEDANRYGGRLWSELMIS